MHSGLSTPLVTIKSLLGGPTKPEKKQPAAHYTGPIADRIQLLIIQPTPFCNINCDYCYLPDRNSAARMERATFRELLSKVLDSGLAPDGYGEQLSVVWHAGEPMVLPPTYYSDLLGAVDDLSVMRPRLRHSLQTNGMLVSNAWCEFIRENDFHVGVSIDGPALLHDRHRKDRQGRGTHARVMKGLELLREQRIDFHVISVITADSLECADEIFQFFLNLGVKRLGFNVEELEGENRVSSLKPGPVESRLERFWARIYDLEQKHALELRIREFDRARQMIVHGLAGMTAEEGMRWSSQIAPLGIVTADWQGNLSSFSPELLGLRSQDYGDFVFGNITKSDLKAILSNDSFLRAATDIYAGVKRCQAECGYFDLCGGGAPSNKYFENDSFASTETMYCRTTIQMPIRVVLEGLESLAADRSRIDPKKGFQESS